MFFPLADERLGGSRRDDHHVGLSSHRLKRLADEREGGDVLDDLADRLVHREAPGERSFQVGIARRGDFGFQGRVGMLRFALQPVSQPIDPRDRKTSPRDLGTLRQEVEHERDTWEAIHPSRRRIEIHKLGDFPRIFGNGGQAIKLNDVGNEAFLVFDFHGIEDAAVAIDPDEEVPSPRKVAQGGLWVAGRGHEAPSEERAGQSDVMIDHKAES